MKRHGSSAVVALLFLVVEMSFLTATPALAEKLRVAYTAFAGTFTILWVGHDAGLYRKAGVDMELLYIGSSTRAVQALLGGDIDIVYSAAGAVRGCKRRRCRSGHDRLPIRPGANIILYHRFHHQGQRAQRKDTWSIPVWVILRLRRTLRVEEAPPPAG